MEEARTVLECLDRIERLEQAGGEGAELLDEVRSLLQAAEAWAKREGAGTERAEAAVARCREALAGGRVPVVAR